MQRLIADHSDDALLHLDSSGTIRFASPASTRLSGRGSVDQLHLAAFFSEFDRKKVDRALDKASRHPGRTEILERSVGRGNISEKEKNEPMFLNMLYYTIIV